MKAAVQAFRDHRFADALSSAEKAYLDGAGPDALEAVAVASLSLGNATRAFAAYQALTTLPNVPPKILERARKQVDSLRHQTGAVDLVGVEAGASVLVDGTLVGQAPQLPEVRGFPGTHTIRVEPQGKPPVSGQRKLVGGGRVTFDAAPLPVPNTAPTAAPPPTAAPSAAPPPTAAPVGLPPGVMPQRPVPIAAPAAAPPPSAPPSAPAPTSAPPSDTHMSGDGEGPLNAEFRRLVFFGNLDATKTTGTGGATDVQIEAGPSYVYRSDKGEWGYYLQSVVKLTMAVNSADPDPAPRALNLSLSGPLDIFGNTDTPSSGGGSDTSSGTTSSPSQTLGQFVGSFATAGVKRYMSPISEYFAFAELQVAWDTALGDKNGRGGDNASYTPDARILVGPGLGRIVNLASQLRVRALEADLTALNLLRAPFTPEIRLRLAAIYDAESDPLLAGRRALDLLGQAGLLTAAPNFDETMKVVSTAQNALRFRLRGMELKAGALLPAMQSKQTEAQNGGKSPLVTALQALYTVPYTDQMQITAQGGLSYQTTPSATSILNALMRVDRKYSSTFQVAVYGGFTYVDQSKSSDMPASSLFQVRGVGQTNYYVADNATWQTTLQLTNTSAKQTGSAEQKQTELRLMGNFAYTY